MYVGQSQDQILIRGQSGEKISCSDEKFDEMFCMFDRDLKILLDKCLSEKETSGIWNHLGGD